MDENNVVKKVTVKEKEIDNMLCQPVCNDEDLTTSR